MSVTVKYSATRMTVVGILLSVILPFIPAGILYAISRMRYSMKIDDEHITIEKGLLFTNRTRIALEDIKTVDTKGVLLAAKLNFHMDGRTNEGFSIDKADNYIQYFDALRKSRKDPVITAVPENFSLPKPANTNIAILVLCILNIVTMSFFYSNSDNSSSKAAHAAQVAPSPIRQTPPPAPPAPQINPVQSASQQPAEKLIQDMPQTPIQVASQTPAPVVTPLPQIDTSNITGGDKVICDNLVKFSNATVPLVNEIIYMMNNPRFNDEYNTKMLAKQRELTQVISSMDLQGGLNKTQEVFAAKKTIEETADAYKSFATYADVNTLNSSMNLHKKAIQQVSAVYKQMALVPIPDTSFGIPAPRRMTDQENAQLFLRTSKAFLEASKKCLELERSRNFNYYFLDDMLECGLHMMRYQPPARLSALDARYADLGNSIYTLCYSFRNACAERKFTQNHFSAIKDVNAKFEALNHDLQASNSTLK